MQVNVSIYALKPPLLYVHVLSWQLLSYIKFVQPDKILQNYFILG